MFDGYLAARKPWLHAKREPAERIIDLIVRGLPMILSGMHLAAIPTEATIQENVMKVVHLCQISTVLLLTVSPSLADDLSGTWLRDNGEMRVKFDPCGEAMCGTIVWIRPDSDSKAKVGQRVFFDMRPAGANSWTGEAEAGDGVYSGKMSIEGSTLTTTGCLAGGLICKSANWKKVP
jgi:uncharacterized protein (DUF2147 family)